eukprot:RCo021387
MPPSSDLENFFEWLSMKCPGVKHTCGIEHCEGFGRAVVARQPVKAGEKVISVPYDLCFTECSVYRHPILGPLLKSLPGASSEQVMCTHILYEYSDPGSFWAPYVRLFPGTFDTLEYFSEDELRFLGSSLRRGKVERRKLKIKRHFDGVLPLYESHRDIFPSAKFNLDTFTWAYNVLDSRAFNITSPEPHLRPGRAARKGSPSEPEVKQPPAGGPERRGEDLVEESLEDEDEDDEEEEDEEDEEDAAKNAGREGGSQEDASDWALVPLADMMNHRLDGETEYGFDVSSRMFEVTASRDYEPGDQIFLKYNSMDTWGLLKHYGFVVPENPYAYVPVQDSFLEDTEGAKDSVFHIAKMRLFTEHELHRNLYVTRTSESSKLLQALRIRFLSEDEFPEYRAALRNVPVSNTNDLNVYQFLMRYCKKALECLQPPEGSDNLPPGSHAWMAFQVFLSDRGVLEAALARVTARYRELCQLIYHGAVTAQILRKMREVQLADPMTPEGDSRVTHQEVAQFTRVSRLIQTMHAHGFCAQPS